jgi:hypothetical protein
MFPPTHSLAYPVLSHTNGRKPPVRCAATPISGIHRAASLCPKEGNFLQSLSFAISDDSASLATFFLW